MQHPVATANRLCNVEVGGAVCCPHSSQVGHAWSVEERQPRCQAYNRGAAPDPGVKPRARSRVSAMMAVPVDGDWPVPRIRQWQCTPERRPPASGVAALSVNKLRERGSYSPRRVVPRAGGVTVHARSAGLFSPPPVAGHQGLPDGGGSVR